ncbi:hypothetical protein LCGC14_2371420 [marine sediment metagenome]|uniref:Uncharacterized protein n=1 Tax=marine sediment metagenome TaxID=412755 RepID=A0A0F9CQX2_9ZZZZ
MKVNVRKYGDESSEETFDNITTIQVGRNGTIVWVSTDDFEVDLLLTIGSHNHVTQEGRILWVRGPND